jgi:hypothetical protein
MPHCFAVSATVADSGAGKAGKSGGSEGLESLLKDLITQISDNPEWLEKQPRGETLESLAAGVEARKAARVEGGELSAVAAAAGGDGRDE